MKEAIDVLGVHSEFVGFDVWVRRGYLWRERERWWCLWRCVDGRYCSSDRFLLWFFIIALRRL